MTEITIKITKVVILLVTITHLLLLETMNDNTYRVTAKSEHNVSIINTNTIVKEDVALMHSKKKATFSHAIMRSDPVHCDKPRSDICFDLGFNDSFNHNATTKPPVFNTHQFIPCPNGHSINYCVGWIAQHTPDYNTCKVEPRPVTCTYGSVDWQNGEQDESNKADADWANHGLSGYNDTPSKIQGHAGNTNNDPSDTDYNQGWQSGYTDQWSIHVDS